MMNRRLKMMEDKLKIPTIETILDFVLKNLMDDLARNGCKFSNLEKDQKLILDALIKAYSIGYDYGQFSSRVWL